MIEIVLTWPEVFQAATIAVMRHVSAMQRGLRDKYGIDKENYWTSDIEGACGEMAVAKMCGLYWNGTVGSLKTDDVGLLQIRTRSRHHYELIVHDDDPDDRAFVLVTGNAPKYRIVGWLFGRDAKRKEWWKDPAGGRPAYFVPHDALRPMEDLIS